MKGAGAGPVAPAPSRTRFLRAPGQLPVSLANLFKRFKLTSLSFKAGLSSDELGPFHFRAGCGRSRGLRACDSG